MHKQIVLNDRQEYKFLKNSELRQENSASLTYSWTRTFRVDLKTVKAMAQMPGTYDKSVFSLLMPIMFVGAK